MESWNKLSASLTGGLSGLSTEKFVKVVNSSYQATRYAPSPSILLTSSLTALSSERLGQIPQEEITELPAGLSGFLSSRASL